MKTLTAIFFLFACLSFAPLQEDEKDKSAFYATVDGKMFQLREDQLFRGLVLNKTGSLDGRAPNRIVINTTFNGPSYDASEGRLFNETIQFEISYEADKLGEPSIYAVAMQYALLGHIAASLVLPLLSTSNRKPPLRGGRG